MNRKTLFAASLVTLVGVVCALLAWAVLVPRRSPKLSTVVMLNNIQLGLSSARMEFGKPIDELLRDPSFHWESGVSSEARLRILLEILGFQLPVIVGESNRVLLCDSWGSPLNFQLLPASHAVGSLSNIPSRIRLWSNGPNRINEHGLKDDLSEVWHDR
jgi:hypothetical protein